MDKEEKHLLVAFLTLLILVFGVCAMMKYDQSMVRTLDASLYEMTDDVEYSIDSVEKTDEYLRIEGWAILSGEEIYEAETYVALMDTEKNTYYQLPTEMETRTDITEYKGDGVNYDYCGFYSCTLLSELKWPWEDYRICILYKSNGNNKLVLTERGILDENTN